MSEQLGFIGVGLMGHGIAANLLRAGHGMSVLGNRNRAPVDDLVSQGAHEVKDHADLAERAEIIFLCVTASPQVESNVEALLPHLRAGQLIVDVTTAKPESTMALAGKLAERGVGLVDAPVTRGPKDSEAGRLVALVGAEAAAFARVRPLLESYCETVVHMGGVGAGHTAKLLNNFVTMGYAALIAQAYGAATAAGVDWHGLHTAMSMGAARSGTLEKMVKPALEGDFQGHQFAVANGLKDASYARAMLQSLGRDSDLAAASEAYMQRAVDVGLGDRMLSELLRDDPMTRG